MNRERIAGHDGTDANPPWRLEHLTDSGGVDEYSLDVGEGWLVFDPREQADRDQMVQLGNALLDAVRAASGGPVARYVEPEPAPVPDLLGLLRESLGRRDPTSQRGPHKLGCPAGDRDPDGIEKCRCGVERVTR